MEGPLTDRRAAVLARIRAIPEGFVRTYGDVSPGAPRFAGTVLHEMTPADGDLPWWRVVRADGSLAKGSRQAAHLREEDVPFRRGRVDMRAARLPDDVDLT
jgi:methylated-DNA-protein-cysteine methyltransferase related protein